MFGLLGGKLSLYAIIALLVGLAAGSIYLTIHHLNARLESMLVENQKIAAANASLSADIVALKFEQNQINRENTQARNADLHAEQAIQSMTITAARQNKLQKLRQSKPLLILHLINKNLECERLHYLQDGKCVNGVWKQA